jgi:hypothetical protein
MDKDLFVDDKWDKVRAPGSSSLGKASPAGKPPPTTLPLRSPQHYPASPPTPSHRQQFIDLSLRRTVYGTLAGALFAAMIFRE